MRSNIIYLDNASTRPLYPEAAQAMRAVEKRAYGNPSSPHRLGEEARRTLDNARDKLAHEIRANVHEILFTSGATEANNLALQGVMHMQSKKRKLMISAIEHASVYETAQALKKEGYEVTEIGVDTSGRIDLKELERVLGATTALVSVIHGHNEFGVVQDIAAIGSVCRRKGTLFHTDAAQSFGKMNIDVQNMHVDLLSMSAHKIGGPAGIGALYARDGVQLRPLIFGGGQERGLRGGTEHVAGAAGFAKALEIAKSIDGERVKKLRDTFMKALEKRHGVVTGSREERLWNNVHVSFHGIDAEQLVVWLSQRGVMCSTRSACSTREVETSRILRALGMKKAEIYGALRFTLSEETRRSDLVKVVKLIEEYLQRFSNSSGFT